MIVSPAPKAVDPDRSAWKRVFDQVFIRWANIVRRQQALLQFAPT
jgi:hypothetical protein